MLVVIPSQFLCCFLVVEVGAGAVAAAGNEARAVLRA